MITFISYNCVYFLLIFKDFMIRIYESEYVVVVIRLQDCCLFLIRNILGYVPGCMLAALPQETRMGLEWNLTYLVRESLSLEVENTQEIT